MSGDCNLDADIFSDAVFNELMQCHPPNAVGFQRQVTQFVYSKLTLKQTAQCFYTFAMKVEYNLQSFTTNCLPTPESL